MNNDGSVNASAAAERTDYTYTTLGNTASVSEYADTDQNPSTPLVQTRLTTTPDPVYNFTADTRTETTTSPEGTITHEYSTTTGLLTDTWTGNTADPSAATTHTIYGYDALGRLTSTTAARINNANVNQVTTYAYDLDGNLACETLPNGDTENYDYDSWNRLYHVLVKNAAGFNLFEQTYTLLDSGQRDHVIEKRWDGQSADPFSKVRIAWTYDNENRLLTETRQTDPTPANGTDDFAMTAATDYATTFTLDLAGNRLHKTQTGYAAADTAYLYNERDQLKTETTGGVATNYTYDDNGSTLTITTGSAVTTYTWDLRNRMASATVNETTTIYGYDSDGIRTCKIIDGVATYFLNDSANPTGYAKPIEESATLGGDPSLTYTLGLTLSAQTDAAGATAYLIRDGHGYARALADASGAVTQKADFDAFGNMIGTGTFDTTWFGCDGYFDSETGQYYNLARYRKDFRFMSEDDYGGNKADPQSLHKYLYCSANPIRGIDPTGHFTLMELAVTVSIITVLAAIVIPAVIYAKRTGVTSELQQQMRDAIATMNLNRPDAAINYSAMGLPTGSTNIGDVATGPTIAQPTSNAEEGTVVIGGPGNNAIQPAPTFDFPLGGDQQLAPLPAIAFKLKNHDGAPMLVLNFASIKAVNAGSEITKKVASQVDMSNIAMFVKGDSGAKGGNAGPATNWFALYGGQNTPIKTGQFYNVPIDVQSVWIRRNNAWQPGFSLNVGTPGPGIPF